jgi:hypothetical protein
MKNSEYKKAMDEKNRRMMLENREGDFYRARSMSVGTTGGGVTEISMRLNSGQTAWHILQPVEVIELIHQLSANVGCHIAMKPREDFSSWRQWQPDTSVPLLNNGWPPFANDIAPHAQVGLTGPALPSSDQSELQITQKNKDTQNDQLMATEKTVNKRISKRTTKTS